MQKGIQYHQQGHLEQAAKVYREVLKKNPRHADALHLLGVIAIQNQDPNSAVNLIQQAIAIQANNPIYYSNLGVALQSLVRYDEAIAAYDRALSLNPNYGDAHLNRGVVLNALKRVDESLASLDRAIALNSQLDQSHFNRGIALEGLNRLEEAVQSYLKAIEINPNDAHVHYNLGHVFHQLRRFDQAIACYDKAIQIDPNSAQAYWNKALALLVMGNYEQGWSLHEWRWKSPKNGLQQRQFAQALWLGEKNLQGKTILIYCEQGFGDSIQFCRYIKQLAQLGARVVFEVPRPLFKLFKTLQGVAQLIEEGEALPAFDFQCPLMSLPLALKTTLSTIPNETPYLRPDPQQYEFWKSRIRDKTKFKVGVAWSGGLRPFQPESWAVHRRRNIDLTVFSSALHDLDVHFYSLQKGDPAQSEITGHEAKYWPRGNFFNDVADLKDFSDTAALIANLDLVICVDTAIAHLSAALGKTVWLLNRYDTCWRWLLDRSDSPWYPTVKIYRQPEPGAWPAVMTEVARDLLFQQGFALHKQGDLTQAQAIYEKVLQQKNDHADALHFLGLLKFQAQDYSEAIHLLKNACQINANNPVVHYNCAVVLNQAQQSEEAIHYLDLAIQLQPSHPQAHFVRANILLALQRWQEALQSFDCAVAVKPDHAQAFCNRGIALKALGQTQEALASYEKALAIIPDYKDAQFNRANALSDLSRFEEALLSYQKVLAIQPDDVFALINQGNVLQDLMRWHEALQSYDLAIQIQPDQADAYANRGIVLQKLNRFDDALSDFNKTIAIRQNHADDFYNRASLFKALNQLEAAIADDEQAIQLNPRHAPAYANRGNALRDLCQIQAAIESYDKALAINPELAEAQWNKGLALLLNGQFEAGWPLYEWRWKNKNVGLTQREFKQPLWHGQNISGQTILLHAEQGLGDTIQFCRYVKRVSDSGARVLLEVHKPLMSLLQQLPGVDQLIERGQALPEFDVHCPLLTLPKIFNTQTHTIPLPNAYLSSDAEKTKQWAQRLGYSKKPRIGIVWSGSLHHDNDKNRSLSLHKLLQYLPTNYAYVSLQKELRPGDHDAIKSNAIPHFGDELKDFSDTAALCDLMDLVISVDTSVAHLSAALGRKTWVLLPFAPDWRWLLNTQQSPWYSSVKLYRQNADKNWDSPLMQIAADLA